jgi:hypothetical protein
VDRKGDRFEPYIRLGLWHHHLGRSGEPLLILQRIGDDAFGIALTSHVAYFHNDKLVWLKAHMAAVDWSDCEDLRQEVAAYSRECK